MCVFFLNTGLWFRRDRENKYFALLRVDSFFRSGFNCDAPEVGGLVESSVCIAMYRRYRSNRQAHTMFCESATDQVSKIPLMSGVKHVAQRLDALMTRAKKATDVKSY